QHVAADDAARDVELGLLEQALVVALEVALALRRQQVDVGLVGDAAHVAPHHVRDVRAPGGRVVGGRYRHRHVHRLLGRFLLLAGRERKHEAGDEQGLQRMAGPDFHGQSTHGAPLYGWLKGVAQARIRCHSACSALATAGGTNPETSPPRREISRTSEDEMKPYCSAGVRNSVSTSGIRWRFMLASWNSYSKSDTARSPRSRMPAPISWTKCASRESKPRTSTCRWCASASRVRSTRSCSPSAGRLAGLSATPTIRRSNSGAARFTRSTCPLVIGSKVPG